MKQEIPDFGLQWPMPASPLTRRLYCARHGVGNVPRWEQRKAIIQAIWPENVYAWHRWVQRRLKGTCVSPCVTWAGPGGSAKTTDAAVLGLEWWLEAPHETAVIVCSTTVKMLKKRIWAQMAHFHSRMVERLGPQAGNLGELIDSETMIRWKQGDNKNGIFGLAVDDGPVEEAINNLIGIHTTRVWLILDEMQGVRDAIVNATRNMAKNPEFRFLGIGNPESLLDPLGRASEPEEGWSSIDMGVTEWWKTKGVPGTGGGICQFFNGMESPADDSEEERKRLYWLINKDWIEKDLKSVNGNSKDPSFLSQSIGIWPGTGLENTVLDPQLITSFNCQANAVWITKPTQWASIDPSFEGNDDKILQFGKRGQCQIEGSDKLRWVIEFGDWIKIPIDTTSPRPIHYQIVDYVKKECQKRGIPPEEVAIDSTGEGGGLLAIFHTEWGAVIGVEFGGNPSDMPVSETNPRPANEVYDRRVSELNLSLRTFASLNAIRGLSDKVCEQACARRTMYKGKKFQVEPKKEMKKRIGRSPDNLDAACVGIDLCRQKGVVPSSSPVSSNKPAIEAMARQSDEYFSEENYLQSVYE
jgi:hypothetical protein